MRSSLITTAGNYAEVPLHGSFSTTSARTYPELPPSGAVSDHNREDVPREH